MRFLSAFCLWCLLIASSCNDEPTSPVDWGTPPGMPNWYSSEYHWIDSVYEKCAAVTFFEPKTIIRVGGTSPDGTTILGVHRYKELFLYNTQARQVTERIGEDIERFQDARWSNDGSMIIGSHLHPDFSKEFAPYLYHLNTQQGKLISLPDTLEPVGQYILFAEQDTSLLLYRYPPHKSDIPSYSLYSLVSQKVVDSPMYDAIGNIAVISNKEHIWFRHNYISPDFSESVDLRYAPLNQPDNISTYRLPNVLRVGRAQLSRDGNWLSALMEVRLPDDRFHSASAITGLGIIDLRPGSPYRYKIYAFYPDHSNTFKLCVNGFTLPGSAWSPDNKYVYHEQIRLADTTVQIVRREVATGKVEVISDFKGAP